MRKHLSGQATDAADICQQTPPVVSDGIPRMQRNRQSPTFKARSAIAAALDQRPRLRIGPLRQRQGRRRKETARSKTSSETGVDASRPARAAVWTDRPNQSGECLSYIGSQHTNGAEALDCRAMARSRRRDEPRFRGAPPNEFLRRGGPRRPFGGSGELKLKRSIFSDDEQLVLAEIFNGRSGIARWWRSPP